MFHAIGRFSYRFRWLVIGIWALLFIGGLVATPFLGDVLKGGGFSSSDLPSDKAAALISQRLNLGPSNLVIVFQSETLEAQSTEFQALEAQALAGLTAQNIPHLADIQTHASTGGEQLISQDGRSSVAVLSFDADDTAVQGQVALVRETVNASLAAGAEGTALTAYVTGSPAVDADMSELSMKDLRTVELYALPVALLALLVVFGTLVAAALPVLAGGVAVSVTLGIVYLLARATDMSIFVMNTATLLGLAIAIDYALLIVARFREELETGSSVGDAVVRCTERAGRSVFFSGMAVIVGILGLLFFPFSGLRSIGIGGAIVVFFSVAISLTLMPAILGVLGPRINAVRIVPHHPVHKSRFWRGWTTFLTKRPWVVLVVSLLLILTVAFPVLHLKMDMPSATVLPGTVESRQGYDILDRDFDRAALSPISVLVTWDGGSPTLSMAEALPMFEFGQTLAATPGVKSVTSLFNLPGLDPAVLAGSWEQLEQILSGFDMNALVGGAAGGDAAADLLASLPPEGLQLPGGMTISPEQLGQLMMLVRSSIGERAVLFHVAADAAPTSTEAQDLAGTLAALHPPAGFEVHVAGEAASQADFFQGLIGRIPWVVAYVLVATYLILLFMLRSLLLPLKAVLVNALTIFMSIGCLVFIFQDGRFQGILNYTSTGGTDAIILVIIFCALFGISMDYGVFSLTRMHEAWLETRDNHAAIRSGLIQSGRVILSAALLVVVVTAAFAFTRISLTKELGIGIALAIALDALLLRMSLVPALMCYLKRANWWMPAWLDRILPDTGHEGGVWRAWRCRERVAAPGRGTTATEVAAPSRGTSR
ncbi:MAG: MMPL family transporter [Actinobacteria bacterium]|nr:MMPL family transporter [Actinomycetota bacterium]